MDLKPWQLPSIREDDGEEGEPELELFYEEIEAPKFVDLALSADPFRVGDDRYWFCQRVGCDQKHLEEMDPEEIYKNFVLRVMAARSPNVKLRKALNKRAISDSKKCPASAPPKPSRSRKPRLAVIPIFPLKKTGSNEIVRPPPKPVSTPKARMKNVAAKYMTTPRGRRYSGNPKPFQSVRIPEKTSTMQKIDKGVAKALVFKSPQKSGKPKALEELSHPITTLCKKMKKLEITSQKKGTAHKVSTDMVVNDTQVSSSIAITKPACAHKTRIQKADIAHHRDGERHEANTCRKRKGWNEEDGRKQNQLMHCEETADCRSSETTRNGSAEDSLTSSSLRPKIDEKCGGDREDTAAAETLRNISSKSSHEEATSIIDGPPMCQDSSARSSADIKSPSETLIESEDKVPTALHVTESQGLDEEEQSSSDKKEVDNVGCDLSKERGPLDHCIQGHQISREGPVGEYVDISDNKNAPAFYRCQSGKDSLSEQHDKKNVHHADKENIIRNLNVMGHQTEKEVSSKHEKTRKPKKMQVVQTTGAILKENNSSGACDQENRQKKLKVTNPKPFRLRTNERGILKEATLEKKLNVYEAGTTLDLSSETSQRDHWNSNTQVIAEFSVSGRSRDNAQRSMKRDLKGLTKEKLLQTRTKKKKDSKLDLQTRSGTLKPKMQILSQQQKPVPVKLELKDKGDRDVVHAFEEKSTMAKSSLLHKEPIRPQGRGASSKASEGKQSNGVSCSTSLASETHRPTSKVRRPLTIPKEPNFHSTHLPKTCTKAGRIR